MYSKKIQKVLENNSTTIPIFIYDVFKIFEVVSYFSFLIAFSNYMSDFLDHKLLGNKFSFYLFALLLNLWNFCFALF